MKGAGGVFCNKVCAALFLSLHCLRDDEELLISFPTLQDRGRREGRKGLPNFILPRESLIEVRSNGKCSTLALPLETDLPENSPNVS